MVVTRRAPAPVPASRTNSAQPIPKVKGNARLQTTPDASSPLANGTGGEGLSKSEDSLEESAAKKAKGKWKNKAKKDKQKRKTAGSAFVELLTRIFLLWFTVYTITVCPTDEALKSPVCRGLTAYRHYVLDPYIIPPVQRALAHPSIAPYVNRVTPAIQSSIDTAKPILIRVNSEWNHRVVPQWKKRVIPQWQKHVDPQLDKYLWPRIHQAQATVTPYITTAQQTYDRRVGPQVRFALRQLETWQHQARPYVILAAHKTYDGYQVAKPYARPVLEQLQALLLRLLHFLLEQRRQFVDPHVHKIWERVKELSSGETKPVTKAANAFSASVSKVSASASSVLSSALETSSSLVPAASEAVIASASAILPDTVSETESLPSPYPSTNPTAVSGSVAAPIESASSLASSISEEAASKVTAAASAASSVTESLSSAASSVASVGASVVLDNAAVSSASSFIKESIATPAASFSKDASASAASAKNAASAKIDSIASEASSVVGSVTAKAASTAASVASSILPTPPSADSDSDEDLDLENLYAELGLDDLESEPTDKSDSGPSDEEYLEPELEPEDEEAKAERLRLAKEENAKKRAELVARHANWENKLVDRIAKARKELRRNLVASRKAAAAELKQSPEIQKEIDSFVDDAEKYLKGAEKYLAQSVKDTKSGRTSEEKLATWARVVDKIEKRFAERIGQTEAVVNGWYEKVLNAELAEVNRLREEVKRLAEDAQGDIGLDYAWLDDVAYSDWQRYHDLDRRATNFSKEAISIQDGTHASPPINPVIPAIDELQSEVQDVIVGFENRLNRVRRKGERTFGAAADESDADDVPSDETVSILPIEDEAQKRQNEGESPAVPPIVIGRSKEEIVSALNRVAEQEAQATSPPDAKDSDPEQVVAALAQEVVEENNHASSPAKHEEL